VSGTPVRTVASVTADLEMLACGGIMTPDLKDRTARRVRELAGELCNLVQDATRAEQRRSLARAWGAWLDLMMSTGLEPGLRERFEAALRPGSRG
jgi:hypothetical protein